MLEKRFEVAGSHFEVIAGHHRVSAHLAPNFAFSSLKNLSNKKKLAFYLNLKCQTHPVKNRFHEIAEVDPPANLQMIH